MFSKSPSSAKPSSPNQTDIAKKKGPVKTTRPSVSKAPSILSRDLVITGEISTDGDVQIEGRLEGNVKATTLTIGEHGSVNGSIKAGSVLIRGKVTGKIDAGTVELSETANVLADIKQDHLTIANGAFFDGKCSRKSPPAGGTNKSNAKK